MKKDIRKSPDYRPSVRLTNENFKGLDIIVKNHPKDNYNRKYKLVNAVNDAVEEFIKKYIKAN